MARHLAYPFEIGDYVGPYRLVRRLGQSGTGAVYEAIHDAIERRVAIKFVHPSQASTPQPAARLFQEARTASLIGHPGFPAIYDFGLLEGNSYIVMEYLEGQTLSQRLDDQRGKLPIRQALNIASQCAEILTALHEREVVHRALKPESLMLVPDPEAPGGERVKLLQFGNNQLLDAVSGLVQNCQFISSPRYMAPEQWIGSRLAADRTDVYMLGIILFEMATGESPYLVDSDEPSSWLLAHLSARPRNLRQLLPEVPNELDDLLSAMLCKQLAGRPSMIEAAQRLRACMQLLDIGQQVPPHCDLKQSTRTAFAMRLARMMLRLAVPIALILPAVAALVISRDCGYTHQAGSADMSQPSSSYEEAFARLVKGWFAVDAPKEMMVATPTKLSARAIRNQIAGDLIQAELKHDSPQIYEMRLGQMLKVELKPARDEEFEVVALSAPEQPVLSKETTSWEWVVTPKRPGENKLLELTASNLVDVNGKTVPKSYAAKTIIVQVLVNPTNQPVAVRRTPFSAKPLALILVVGFGCIVGTWRVFQLRQMRKARTIIPPNPKTKKTPLEPLSLFCNYADQDKEFVAALETSMASLKRQGFIASWDKRRLDPGAMISDEIARHMREADIILLLVSPDFMAHCIDCLDLAMERHRVGSARVIPIILRPTDMEGAPFCDLQSLPKNKKPVTSWPNPDEAWLDIANGIRQVASRYLASP